MSLQNVSKSSNALEGIHGVHVTSHSPFSFEKTTQVSDFQTNTKSSVMESNQRLSIEYVT